MERMHKAKQLEKMCSKGLWGVSRIPVPLSLLPLLSPLPRTRALPAPQLLLRLHAGCASRVADRHLAAPCCTPPH